MFRASFFAILALVLVLHTSSPADEVRSVQSQVESIRNQYFKPSASKSDRQAALELLKPLLENTNEPRELRQIHGLIMACLMELGDEAALGAWEDRFLGETWLTLDDRAGIAAQRGDRAYKWRKHDEAAKQWRLICESYPETSHFGVAQFNLGFLLQEQGKLPEAIGEYQKLFPSQVNDKDPGSNIMEAYRNYRNRGAKQISRCYDKLGKPRQALEWAILARDKYRYQSWCGTCLEQERAATAADLVRLKHKAGDTAEALRDAEALVFSGEHYVRAIHVPQIIAEECFAQGRTQELLDRLDKFSRENIDNWTKQQRRSDPDRPFDGHTDASRLIVEYLAILKLANDHDLTGLWRWIQESQISAQEALLPASLREGAVGLAAAQLTKDRAASVDFLKGRFRNGDDVERAWSAVLLAKVGEVKNVEALHRLAAAVQPGSSTAEAAQAAKVQTDFFYAALLADPAGGKAMVDRYMQTDLTYSAQNAYYRERNSTLLAMP